MKTAEKIYQKTRQEPTFIQPNRVNCGKIVVMSMSRKMTGIDLHSIDWLKLSVYFSLTIATVWLDIVIGKGIWAIIDVLKNGR